MIGALVFLANRERQAGSDRSAEAMSAVFDARADEATCALAGHWARITLYAGIHVKVQIWHALANPAI
jgi:hypothetical protein